jgi:hypothetical protein
LYVRSIQESGFYIYAFGPNYNDVIRVKIASSGISLAEVCSDGFVRLSCMAF